ncbi:MULTISPECIES: hypothetical protein [unclassified Streptomyces]|nr:hypothetical protein OH827_32775 [Streptomyces sp. NBC_00891]WSY09518.1 hypothetical protein OG464_32780 [Streptomyces sp. NBC_00890]WSZ11138.1 hypothetical protein OG704_32780 [Streptomyces sp. NBC_00869]WSZ21356.1 hypothetical protein OG498_00785 [Streptomyces sp. NBC_00870]
MVRAHIQLGGPIVVWGSLNTHAAAGLKQYGATYDWLTLSGCRRLNPA